VSTRGYLGRQIQSLQKRWQAIAGSEYDEETAGLRPDLPESDRSSLLMRMRECLNAQGGEISARSQAAALGRAYLTLNEEGREAFLKLLAREFDLDAKQVAQAAQELIGAGTPEETRAARMSLLAATESPRTQLLTRFNALPQGVKFLVDMRADLLPLAKRDPVLASLDDDLEALLRAWFNVDFLELKRISWNTAPAALLEKFMAYEAVHPVESWGDLKNRLDHDRRYFAFFHPRMPDEPLIFLEVALVKGMAGNIQELLDPSSPVGDPSRADTAIFYSISNAQRGLAGISFGGFLIKRVVGELAAEFQGLKTFATLSPLPRFRVWLERAFSTGEDLLLPQEIKRLAPKAGDGSVESWLAKVVAASAWREDEEMERTVRPVLLRLAARYLTQEKRARGGALDPVAHFHLSNGARVERLNWAADTSGRGSDQSAGIMANYLYDARKIEENHEAYRGAGKVVSSGSVRSLLKG
jgi:malonyl-CoA decarboxylase